MEEVSYLRASFFFLSTGVFIDRSTSYITVINVFERGYIPYSSHLREITARNLYKKQGCRNKVPKMYNPHNHHHHPGARRNFSPERLSYLHRAGSWTPTWPARNSFRFRDIFLVFARRRLVIYSHSYRSRYALPPRLRYIKIVRHDGASSVANK